MGFRLKKLSGTTMNLMMNTKSRWISFKQKESAKIQNHILRLNKWTIKLSDIETLNFGLTWVLVICLQLFTIIVSANEAVAYGTILSIVLYVFEFAETSIQIPYSWQEYLRLKDIFARVRKT
jgi:hypothetical protein